MYNAVVSSSLYLCAIFLISTSSPPPISRYNPKSTETLVGGSYNGLINFFDLRKPGAQVCVCASTLILGTHNADHY